MLALSEEYYICQLCVEGNFNGTINMPWLSSAGKVLVSWSGACEGKLETMCDPK